MTHTHRPDDHTPCPRTPRLLLATTALVLASACGGPLDNEATDPDDTELLEAADTPLVTGTPAMAVARAQHTATLLASGRVLVVGGNETALPSVELYDPASNTWASDTPLATNRRYHTATLLADGSVLVVGGINGNVLSSCERYQPGPHTWTACAPLPRSSYGHTATLLTDGRVLVTGGVGYVTNTYLYTPATNAWTSAAPLPAGLMAHAAVRVADGSVLVTGGRTSLTDSAAAHRYFPATNTWQSAGTMFHARADHSMVFLPTTWKSTIGVVMISGGNQQNRWEYWHAVNGFGTMGGGTTLGNHSRGTLVALPDGATLLLGDASGNRGIERMPDNSWTWALVDQLPSARDGVPATALADGRVLIPGGNLTVVNGANQNLASSAVWSSVACVPATCAGLGLTCGGAPDGCGGTLSCGACPGSATYDAALRVPLCSSVGASCSAVTTGRASVGPEVNAPNTLGGTCADGTSGSFHADESIDGLRITAGNGDLRPGAPATVAVDVWAYAGFGSDRLDVFVTPDASAAAPVWTLVSTLTPLRAGASTLSVPLTLPASSASRMAVRTQFRYGGSATACASGGYNDRDDLAFAVPVVVAPAGLVNGGFDTTVAPWTVVGNTSIDGTAGLSQSGLGHLVLRPQHNSPASVRQAFTVPAGITRLVLWARPETAFPNSLDVNLSVSVTSPGIQTLSSAVASNLSNPGVWSRIELDIARFAGAPVVLTLTSASTVFSSSELFRVDTVGVQ